MLVLSWSGLVCVWLVLPSMRPTCQQLLDCVEHNVDRIDPVTVGSSTREESAHSALLKVLQVHCILSDQSSATYQKECTELPSAAKQQACAAAAAANWFTASVRAAPAGMTRMETVKQCACQGPKCRKQSDAVRVSMRCDFVRQMNGTAHWACSK